MLLHSLKLYLAIGAFSVCAPNYSRAQYSMTPLAELCSYEAYDGLHKVGVDRTVAELAKASFDFCLPEWTRAAERLIETKRQPSSLKTVAEVIDQLRRGYVTEFVLTIQRRNKGDAVTLPKT
jgi:hypothetical protein